MVIYLRNAVLRTTTAPSFTSFQSMVSFYRVNIPTCIPT